MAGRLSLARRAGALALVLGVVAVHAWLAERLAERLPGLGAEEAMPPRIEVAYVREMEPAAPPAVAPAPPPPAPPRPRPRRLRAVAPAPAASAAAEGAEAAEAAAPASAASTPATPEVVAQAPVEPPSDVPAEARGDPVEPPSEAAVEATEPQRETPAEAAHAGPEAPAEAARPASEAPPGPASEALPAVDPDAPVEPAASAPDRASPADAAASAGAAPFRWPASTRLGYVLTGHFRGPIDGSAQVEWVRAGERYQVHLDVTVGLPFAPLFTRRMTSDGRLTPDGLAPQRYDEQTRQLGAPTRRATIRFEPDAVLLPGGRRVRWAGAQDAASQFVQLTYLFTLHPALLTPGNVLEVPLALPRHVSRWVYDVVGPQTLYTPFGAVEAVHVKPRHVARAGGDLSAEIWFAPSLAYLPARILIRQDESTYIDLMIKRKPELAAS